MEWFPHHPMHLFLLREDVFLAGIGSSFVFRHTSSTVELLLYEEISFLPFSFQWGDDCIFMTDVVLGEYH